MSRYAPYAAKLPKQFWLNMITSLIVQIMVNKFNPDTFFGLSSNAPVISAKELATAFKGMSFLTVQDVDPDSVAPRQS